MMGGMSVITGIGVRRVGSDLAFGRGDGMSGVGVRYPNTPIDRESGDESPLSKFAISGLTIHRLSLAASRFGQLFQTQCLAHRGAC